jgi:hypothetical protein
MFTAQLGTRSSWLGGIELGLLPFPTVGVPALPAFSLPIMGVPWRWSPAWNALPFTSNAPTPTPPVLLFTPPGSYGLPIRGVPWRWIIPVQVLTSNAGRAPVPAPPSFQPLGLTGAPVFGVPFLAPFMFPQFSQSNVPPPLPPVAGSSAYVPVQRPGVPILGVPWLPLSPTSVSFPPPSPPPPVPPPPPPGPPGVPNPNRFQVARDPAADQRTRLHIDQTASLLNSLLNAGIIQQAGDGKFVIRAGGYVMPRPPLPRDDASMGVVVGAIWTDTTGGNAYVNVNNSAGSAVWRQIT